MAQSYRELFAGRRPIASYVRGGFRFETLNHPGSLLILPEATFAWDVAHPGELASALPDLASGPALLGDFLLVGTGREQIFPDAAVRAACEAQGLGLEVMDTGAACRTYNLLLAEQRVFSAALIAV